MANAKQWLIISGRLGSDVDQRVSRKGTNYLSFRFASDCGRETAWFSVLVFGEKMAPIKRFFKKGDAIFINAEMLGKDTLKLLDFSFPITRQNGGFNGNGTQSSANDDVADFPFDEIEEIEM